jgi:hypothetical protein
MPTPPGAPGSGQTQPHQQSSNLNWMSSEPLSFPRLVPDNQATPASTSSAATPRRYSPPSPVANDLAEFFGGSVQREWSGVKIERLAANVTVNEVKTMFLFSVGFEDLRIIRGDQITRGYHSAEAYVRLQNKGCAEEAERLLNNKDFNGANIVVTVIPRPSSPEISKMAATTEAYAQDFNSQSPSSSDGAPTPAAASIMSLGEYTTATGPRHIASPLGNGHISTGTNGTNGLVRNDSGAGNGLGGARTNGNGPVPSGEADLFPTLAFDRLTVGEKVNGLGGSKGYDQPFGSSDNYIDNLGNVIPNRGLVSFQGVVDQSLDHDTAVGDNYGSSMETTLGGYSRPRRQTNPPSGASGRFGNLPPLSTMPTNGFSQGGMTSPLTAPPVGAPGLTSPIGLNSPGNWPTSAVSKSYYSSFPITSHPPANPADQNPPCNTLYVGNLPAQTSEDELKALFCRQRGYKRMCFRTKPQGPMCFVEFEDTHYATKALTELYGRALSNSTKGGVRLSFSKNPLGVRSQNNPANPANAQVAKGATTISGSTGVPSHGFSNPPLRTPPGLPAPGSRQTAALPTPTSSEPSGGPAPPPGLFGSGSSGGSNAYSRAQGLPPTASRLPPLGILPSASSFFAGTTPDVRSPASSATGPPPGAIGTR